jgi:hypothetical protein
MNNDIEARQAIERVKWGVLLSGRTGREVAVRKSEDPDDSFSYVYVDNRLLSLSWPTEQNHDILFYGGENSEAVSNVVASIQDAIDQELYVP